MIELPRVCLLVLRTGRMGHMLTFYRAVGLEFQIEQHGSGPLHYAAEVGGVVIEIYPSPSVPEGRNDATLLGLRVESVDAVLNALTGLGARVVTEPRDGAWGRRAVVEDPDGRLVELAEARSPAAGQANR